MTAARANPRREPLAGRCVVVMGLGRFGGGVGVTRWLAGQGCRVRVTDMAGPETLAESLAALEDLDVDFALGGHDPSILDDADLLVVNPAVPDTAGLVVEARRRGVRLTTEINLFMTRCVAPVAGITGTAGKSTTTAMAAAAVETRFRVFMGGNIGLSLLGELEAIGPGDRVILELSSFQLERLAWARLSPPVAAVTNLRPNHLDRHGTMDAYAAAKKNIFAFQRPDDVLLLPAGDATLAGWAGEAPGRTGCFDLADVEGVELKLPGVHNRWNAAAALAVATRLGVERDAAVAGLEGFAGLPDRLERVGEAGGVRYYNDSKATTPEGVLAALESFEAGRVVAIVGGYDKKISLASMCRALAERCRAVVATGAVGAALAGEINSAARTSGTADAPRVEFVGDFDAAVARAVALAEPGDAVLLSPGCASYGQFDNYRQRGRRFRELIEAQLT